MEVVAAPPPSTGGSPFRDHDVREWSRIDTLTGALERARLETDSWSANTRDASHRYGKVVDSRARTGADGSHQAQASRQLEVFHSRAAGSRLQVVKTTTVSSSRWSGKAEEPNKRLEFEDLQLPLNPLDLSSQKSKASVGRSAHRRPPTRHPKTHNFTSSTFASDLHSQLRSAHLTAAANLHRVSRLCHQIHESAVRNAFGRKSPSVSPRGSADGSASGVEITEIESSSDQNSHSNLSRTKSNSSEGVQQIAEKESNAKSDLEDLEQLQSWRRNSKVRRSLPFPKASSPSTSKAVLTDLPENGVNVKKLRDELEKGRRLTTALRNNSISADLNALDNIIQSISSTSSIERSSIDDNLDDLTEKDHATKAKPKRESFVTAESLQEIKGRLRRTTSPRNDIYMSKQEDSDDGIGKEDSKLSAIAAHNQVKSYIYGMEDMLQSKKSVIGTGSLESRSKFANGSNNNKNEDWYNRRKSYGFEKVHGSEETSAKSLKDKTFVESSTDSGICRSSEIMVVPTATRAHKETNGQYNSESESDVENKFSSISKALNGINYGNVRKMTSIFSQEDKSSIFSRQSEEAWNRRLRDSDFKKNELKSTTITIPIVKNNNIVDLSWNDEPEKDTKRHSIALDGSDSYKKDKNELIEDGIRRAKRVEFCKTEVHFAAESGKVNIVETDEKPPPTQNFRRRRRNSGISTDYPEDFNKNGLPMLHFGDSSYEKTMFGVSEDQEVENINSDAITEDYKSGEQSSVPSAFSVVTVNSTRDFNSHTEPSEEEKRDWISESDNLKGILKNKPIKPKPYHLGEIHLNDSDEDSNKWGVRLRHIPRESPTIWKSTVTVRNIYQNNPEETNDEAKTNDVPEFQKLLRNLRPTTKKPDYLSDNENRYSDSFANIRVVPAVKDNRRSSWSVADRVMVDEEIQGSRGYSTKVNFGEGQATVVQNDKSTWPRMENLSKDDPNLPNSAVEPHKPKATYNKYSIHANSSKYSPVVLRKTIPLKSTDPQELLETVPSKLVNKKTENSTSNSRSKSPSREFRNLPDPNLQAKCVSDKAVLRQPKQSEMTYFGLGAKGLKTTKEQNYSQKPDLLQNHKRAASPIGRVGKPRKPTPEKEMDAEHIYENVNPGKTMLKSQQTQSKDFDSAILDELTKAADQILQAVNGYTSEDCQNRLSSDEEELRKPLDTISETRSWKCYNQDLEIRNQQRMRPTLASAAKMKVKRTSSTSSVESLSKDRKKVSSTERKIAAAPAVATKTVSETTNRKKGTGDVNSSKSSTKARRLQRASSREALLQSHGSSSEDLPTNVELPVRKPRLVKKTKATQLTISSGIELKKPVRKSREEKATESNKSEARILGSLPEIRHKTAVSTITNIAEKCSRDRSKIRSEERQPKSGTRRESSSKGTISSSSTRPGSLSSKAQSQRPTTSSRESGVTQHRISTAYVPACSARRRHRHAQQDECPCLCS
ncbi:serine-rich adhesin for platelets isoform X3 [Euwallacea fornicatus]|uniref:serine-rich adhesin for platelets isoform X3 n=1 Tax=Euwallacea fornicatus TaxID=995702 RepID=UPI00338E979C